MVHRSYRFLLAALFQPGPLPLWTNALCHHTCATKMATTRDVSNLGVFELRRCLDRRTILDTSTPPRNESPHSYLTTRDGLGSRFNRLPWAAFGFVVALSLACRLLTFGSD